MTPPPRLHLGRLTTLVAVADHGGMSAAARALGVAQSTVSAHVQQLEGDVGAVLVDRSAPAVRFTEAGRTLLRYGRELDRLSTEALDQVARVSSAPVTGTLRIGGTTTTTERLLPELLRPFLDRYPHVELDLHVGNSADVTARVLAGDLPLALVASHEEHPGLDAVPAGAEEQVVVLAAGHLLATCAGVVEPRLLRTTRMLLREEGSATRRQQVGLADRWGVRSRATLGSTPAIIAAVGAGLGMSVLPRAAVQDALTLRRVAVVAVDPPPEARPLHLVRAHGRPPSLVEERFIEVVRHHAADAAADAADDAATTPSTTSAPTATSTSA